MTKPRPLHRLSRLWSRLGLQTKVCLVIIAPTVTLSAGTFLALAAGDAGKQKQSIVDTTDAIIDALDQDWERVNLMDDQATAAELSDRLQAFGQIQRLWLIDRDGELCYAYTHPDFDPQPPPEAPASGQVVGPDGLMISRELSRGQTPYGRVHVQVDTSRLHAGITRHLILLASITLVIIAGCAAVGMALQRLITRPIIDLAAIAKTVADQEDFSLRAVKKTDDEVGQLAENFNTMMCHVQGAQIYTHDLNTKLEDRVRRRTTELQTANDELHDEIRKREQVQEQLMKASRQAGIAEIATSVLHNVGNVLNSVNVSATMLEEGLRDSRYEKLRRAAEMIQSHDDDLARYLAEDPKGRQVVPYLVQLSQFLEDQNRTMHDEAKGLINNVNHAKRVVSSQQAMAKGRVVLETLSLADTVEDVLKMHLGSMQQRGIELVRDIEPIPRVTTDKHLVLQVLINLVSNAIKALRCCDRAEKRISIRVTLADGGEQPMARIEVSDNGIGIAPERLADVFTFGYTEWAGGTGSGFGLHSAANTAKLLGGGLTAASEGPGAGARFTLVLPMSRQEEGVAA